MSLVPVVICTSISSSPDSILIAFTPLARTFEYWESAVFLTVPCRVTNSSEQLSVNSRTGTTAEIFVSGVTLIRLTIGLPFACRDACGISCTLSQ